MILQAMEDTVPEESQDIRKLPKFRIQLGSVSGTKIKRFTVEYERTIHCMKNIRTIFLALNITRPSISLGTRNNIYLAKLFFIHQHNQL